MNTKNYLEYYFFLASISPNSSSVRSSMSATSLQINGTARVHERSTKLDFFQMLSAEILPSYLHNNCIAICFGHVLEASFAASDEKLPSEFSINFGASVFFVLVQIFSSMID